MLPVPVRSSRCENADRRKFRTASRKRPGERRIEDDAKRNHWATKRNHQIAPRANFLCAADSSAFAELAAGASCLAAGPCRRQAASRLCPRRRECARLLPACVARETQKAASASWPENPHERVTCSFSGRAFAARGTSFTAFPSPPSHGGGTRSASGQSISGK